MISKKWQASILRRTRAAAMLGCCLLAGVAGEAAAQVPPSATEQAQYTGLFAAAAKGDAARIKTLLAGGAPVDARDGHGRTALHVAAHLKRIEAMRALVAGGANPNALESGRYDIVTIAAVADDVPTLKEALALGCSPKNITSRWDGTALIAAAHLGHAEVVKTLIAAGAPLDHVNNLGWTALIESIVLGNGGARHTATLTALVDAGAATQLADRDGKTPLALAQSRGYREMVSILERPRRRRLTEKDFDVIAAGAKLLLAEENKFDSSHLLRGQIADPALRQLHEEGFACEIDYLDLVRVAKSGMTFESVRTPLVFCVQSSTQPNDLCVERHVNLTIGWQDMKAPEPQLRLQLASSKIVDRTFRCDEESDVKRRSSKTLSK